MFFLLLKLWVLIKTENTIDQPFVEMCEKWQAKKMCSVDMRNRFVALGTSGG